jgi:hypothetical protein
MGKRMTTANLDQIIEAVKALNPEEQRQLHNMLEEMLKESKPQMTEEEFEQRLLQRGVISRIPPPIADSTSLQNRKLMEVKGKPLSETVIEERQ